MKTTTPRPIRATRGFGLIEAMIALLILALGLLTMTQLQARMVASSTESQQRMVAQQFADELLARALIDTGNSNCYTLPASGTCSNAAARTATNAWGTAVAAGLPSGSGAAAIDANLRLQVTVSWTGKESGSTRSLVVTTDVR